MKANSNQKQFKAGDRVTVRLAKDVASLMNKATQGQPPYGWASKMFNGGMRSKLAHFAGKLEQNI